MITLAAGFPTTVNPIIQNNLVPVFVDLTPPTYNVDVTQLEEALSPRTRALILAHTLGNPFDLDAVKAFATRHNLWLIEDSCDAVGSEYRGRKVGTFGDLATTSFYPAHHITMGEGGVSSRTNRCCARWSNRSAIGAATAGARPVKTIPAANVSTGNWVNYRAGTITNIPTRTSATT